MESFRLALEVVFPLVIYMIFGGVIRKLNIMSIQNFKVMNEVIFKIFIPLALFMNVYDARIGEVFRPKVFGLTFTGIILIFLTTYIIVKKLVRDRRDAATIIQGIYRSNYVLFGTAVAAPLCSESGMAMIGAVAALVVPLINMLAVVLFESMTGGDIKPVKVFQRCIKNPLVEAGVLGFIFSVLHIPLPQIFAKSLDTLGQMATPLALVILGGILSFGSIKRHKKYLLITTLCRLIIVPFVMLTCAVLLGIRGEALVVILAVFAAPTAVASAPMAQSMGGNGELAGEIVAATTVFSVFTIFLFVFFMSRTGLI